MISLIFLGFRATISGLFGVWILAESLNPEFLRPENASRMVPAHVCLALFGAAMIGQSYVLGRKLRAGEP